MKEIDVKNILVRHGYVFQEHATIYATIKPSVSAYQIGLKQALFANKEHLLHLNKDGIVILPLNEMSGTILEDSIVVLPLDAIEQIELVPKTLVLHFTIKTKQGDIEYKIRRKALGSPWHKTNLTYFLNAFGVSL